MLKFFVRREVVINRLMKVKHTRGCYPFMILLASKTPKASSIVLCPPRLMDGKAEDQTFTIEDLNSFE